MLILLSPSKTLDYDTPLRTKTFTEPRFLSEAERLIEVLRGYDVEALRDLMDLSEKLATLNVERYDAFETPFTPENARQALLAFKGDVYTDFALDAYTEEDFAFAQERVRILSGLYGLLRPLDLMQPYRLEMGTRLENPRGSNLYDFWGSRISRQLNEDLVAQGDDVILNLASNEYFKAVDLDALDGRVVQPVFRDFKNGKYKIISFYAKRARGTMADFIVRERITDLEDLKGFTGGGYYFSDADSTEESFVFLRDEKP